MRRLWSIAGGFTAALVGLWACSDGEEGSADYSEIEGGGPVLCTAVTILAPVAGARITDADDRDRDCANGITMDVRAATNAIPGTPATLLVQGSAVASSIVEQAAVSFELVELPSTGTVELAVVVGGERGCSTAATVTTECQGAPSCEITMPVLSPERPELNGVPVAEGGDRTGDAGEPYQTVFQVLTSAVEGQVVTLTVDGRPNAAVATVVDHVAVFSRVMLVPDGGHTVTARCLGANGKWGTSAQGQFPVDSTAPDLTIVRPPHGWVVLLDDDVDSTEPGTQFEVCGAVTASDAIGVSDAGDGWVDNLCARVGSGPARCVPTVRHGVDPDQHGACVVLDCPADDPFNVYVVLRDDAGNPAESVIRALTCER